MSNKHEELRPDLGSGEASGAFSVEGRVLTWLSTPPEKAEEQQSSLIPAVLDLAESARLAGITSFDQLLIEGSERKILLARIHSDDSFLVLVGGRAMDVGPALWKLKQAAAAVEDSLKETP